MADCKSALVIAEVPTLLTCVRGVVWLLGVHGMQSLEYKLLQALRT